MDGPYRLTAFNNTTGGYTLAPNPSYGGPHSANVPTVQAIPYTSDTAEFNAVLSHSIDIGYMPLTDVPQLSAVKAAGYHVFGYPGWGFAYANYNFADKTGDFNNIINQLYIRQALAHLEDEEGYIKAFFHGAGGLAYGPVPSVPTSPYTPANALKNPYPYSVATAASLLKSHGWTVVPGGTSTCAKPGTGPGECGAGIPAGTKLAFNVLYASDPVIFGEQLTAWASDAKKVGINITLQSGTFNHVITVADDPGSPKTINQWAVAVYGGFTDAYYPTTLGIFNTGGSFNGGFYSNPQADKLITRVGHQRQRRRGQGRGVLPHPGAAQPVPAQLRLHRRVEEQRLRPAGRDRGDDPVLPQHRADVPDQISRTAAAAASRAGGREQEPGRPRLPDGTVGDGGSWPGV